MKIRKNQGKIYEDVCKIPENLGEIPENTGKNGTQHCFDLKNLALNMCRITRRPIYVCVEVIPKAGVYDLCGRTYSHKELLKLFGRVWGNSSKNLSHPQKFGCSYTNIGRHFLKSNNVGRHFCSDFSGILPMFLTNQNFGGCVCTPASNTTGFEVYLTILAMFWLSVQFFNSVSLTRIVERSFGLRLKVFDLASENFLTIFGSVFQSVCNLSL